MEPGAHFHRTLTKYSGQIVGASATSGVGSKKDTGYLYKPSESRARITTSRPSPMMKFTTHNRSCHAERSEASRCLSRQPLRGVYTERANVLRVTACDCSNGQGQFVQIEPCLKRETPLVSSRILIFPETAWG